MQPWRRTAKFDLRSARDAASMVCATRAQLLATVRGPSYFVGRPILSAPPRKGRPVRLRQLSVSWTLRSSTNAYAADTRHEMTGAPGAVQKPAARSAALRWSASPRSVVLAGVFPTKSSLLLFVAASAVSGTRPSCMACRSSALGGGGASKRDARSACMS